MSDFRARLRQQKPRPVRQRPKPSARSALRPPENTIPLRAHELPELIEDWFAHRLVEDPKNYARVRDLIEDFAAYTGRTAPPYIAAWATYKCRERGWLARVSRSFALRKQCVVGIRLIDRPAFDGNDYIRGKHPQRWLRKPQPHESLNDIKRQHSERVNRIQKARRAAAKAKAQQAKTP
jgi:hypothetical protein